MKTANELMSKIDQIAMHNGNGYNNDILDEIKKFESDIRADKTETRIKEFTTDCQLIFEDQAREYCRLHGVTSIGLDQNCINIAGAIMSARKDQDKLTRHSCAEVAISGLKVKLKDVEAAEFLCDQIHQKIMNTKAV